MQCQLSFLRQYKQVAYLIILMSISNHIVEGKITEAMYEWETPSNGIIY